MVVGGSASDEGEKMTQNNKNKNKIVLTEEGLISLQEEYRVLTEVERPEILASIQEARSMGDLSENGMYTAAREKQSFIEGRIRELEDILKKVEVVDSKLSGGNIIGLGSRVKIETQLQEIEYHIVGPEEVNMASGKISHESPLGQALIGKKVGDIIQFTAPVGTVKYKVLEVK